MKTSVKHQRTLALVHDMSAPPDEIVKLRDHAQWNKRDSGELHAKELRIREKFGLHEDVRLHDVSRRITTTNARSPVPPMSWDRYIRIPPPYDAFEFRR